MGTKNIYKEKFLDKIKQYKFLIIVLILLIIAKTVIANFDVIKETYKGYYYSFAVSKFNKILYLCGAFLVHLTKMISSPLSMSLPARSQSL